MTYEQYIEEQKKRISQNKNASMLSRDSYSQNFQSNDEIFGEGSYKPWQSNYAFNPDLDTSQGLYKIAVMSGLEKDAQRVVKGAGGERPQFLSGGVLSDVMDILNIGSYGMVGLAKGKGFIEGVKNRESFSDDDALGKFGWTGKIAGFALDIALDPLTYIAPWKAISKIPGVARTLGAAETRLLGEMTPIEIGDKVIKHRQGGWSPLTFMSNKLAYGFSIDKKTLEGVQEITDSNQAAVAEIDQLMSKLSKIDPEVAKKTLQFKDNNLVRTPIEELQRTMGQEELGVVQDIYSMIETNADRLTELGVLSKEARERHINDYVTQMYQEYVLAKKQLPGKANKGVGIERRTRKELSEEWKRNKGIVDDAGVVYGSTLMKQAKLIKDAELQDYLSKNVAVSADDIAVSGLSQKEIDKIFSRVPEGPRYELARNVDERIALKGIRNELKKVIKERSKTIGDHKELTSHLKKIDSEVDRLHELSKTNVSEAVSGYRQLIDEGGLRKGGAKKQATSAGQKVLANQVKRFLERGKKSERIERSLVPTKQLLSEFMDTDAGIALEKAFNDPQMMYQWRNPEEFFDAIRYPDRKIIQKEPSAVLEQLTDAEAAAKIARAEKQQRKIGALKQEASVLKETNLEMVTQAMNKLEDDYADLLFKKQEVLETMNVNKLGNLAGKYVPKEVWDMVKGTFEPKKEFGEEMTLWFKKAKVIWNPSSYPRNMMSAMIQNWWKLGIGPWNVHKYIEANKIIKNADHEIMKRMRKLGFHENSGVTNELIDNWASSKIFEQAAMKQTGKTLAKVKAQSKAFNRWATGAYGHIDNVAKVAAFKHAVEKGMTDEAALKAAYAATYNYSHVTPFVQRLRTAAWGVPFITFNLKSVPLVASTLANAPHRISVFGKARNDLFKAAGVDGEQEAEAQPEWMRDSAFMLRVPWKDSEGRSMYFDLSYILPVGAIMSGEYLDNPIGQNPVLQTIKELSSNRTFTGHKIFLESDDRDTVIADMAIHVSKLVMPPMVAEQMPQGYQDDGTRIMGKASKFLGTNTQDLGPSERTFYQEMFRLAGMGVQPYDLESKQSALEYRRKAALTQLLVQNDVLGEFSNPYLPKDSTLRTPNPIYDRQVDPLGR